MTGRMPLYVPFMALVTAAYLTLEIPFAVRLVEVLGGDPSREDIDAVEHVGRILTGVAVSIWIIGALVFPRAERKGRRFARALLSALAVSAAATWTTYTALDWIGRAAGEVSAEKRHAAYLSMLARRHVGIEGLPGMQPGDGHDWMAFVALSPALAGPALVSATGGDILGMARREAEARVGPPRLLRERIDAEISGPYARYMEGSRAYFDALNRLPEDAEREYRKIVDRWGGARPTQGIMNSLIVGQLKRKGMRLHQNYVLSDRRTFIAEFERLGREKALDRYDRAIKLQLRGDPLPPGSTLEAFSLHSAVQQRIRDALRLPAGTVPITPGMSSESFLVHVWEPLVRSAQGTIGAAAQADVAEFAFPGAHLVAGREAAQAAALPFMAIILSIAGAILHVFKFTGYVAWMAGWALRSRVLTGRLRHVLAGAFTLVLFMSFSLPGSEVSASPSITALASDNTVSVLSRAAIAIQPGFSEAGRVLGEAGGWLVLADSLPGHRPYVNSGVPLTNQTELRGAGAMPSSPVAVGAYFALPGEMPAPLPRPR